MRNIGEKTRFDLIEFFQFFYPLFAQFQSFLYSNSISYKPENDDIEKDELSELSKSKLAIRMAEAEARMIDGADEYLQLLSVCGLGMECLIVQSSNNEKEQKRDGPPSQ